MGIRFLDEEPTPTEAFEQGLVVEGPANLASLLDLVGAMLPKRPGQQAGPSFSERTRETMTGALGRSRGSEVRPPTTLTGRLLQGAGAGVTEAAPFALIPGGGAGSLLRRGGLEMASGVTGETSRVLAEEAGAGPLAQAGASLAGGLLPLTAGRGLATALASKGPQRIRDKQARRIAAQTLGAPIDDRAEAIRLLDEEIRAPLFGRATVSQTLSGRFPRIEGVVRRAAQSGKARDDLGQVVTRMRIEQAEATRAFAEQGFQGGSPREALSRFQEAAGRVQSKVKRAYKNVGNLEGIPTRKLKADAARLKIEAEAEGLEDLVPQAAIDRIDALGETTDLRKLDGLRSRLLETGRKAGRAGDLQTERFANRLRNTVEEVEAELAEVGGSRRIHALRRARRIRRIEEERFGETRVEVGARGRKRRVQDPLNRMLGGEKEDLDTAFRSFLATDPKPAEVLRRTKLTLGDSPEAWGGIRELMRNRIFGEDFGRILTNEGGTERVRRGFRAVRTDLRRNRESFDVVFGENAAQNAERFLDRAEKLAQGVVGRSDEFFVSGSNFAPTDEGRLLNTRMRDNIAEGLAGNRLGFIRATTNAIRTLTGKLPQSLEDADILLTQALVDPRMAKGFLESLGKEEASQWARHVQLFLTNTTRAAAGAPSSEQSEALERAPRQDIRIQGESP